MKKCILFSALASLSLGACASQNVMDTPKALPDNWSAPNMSLAQNPSLRGPQNAEPAMPVGDARMTSLWSSSPKSLFGDRRASQYGDILTVVIEIDDEAEIKNSVDQSRQTDEDFSVDAFFGIPELINKALPTGASLSPAVDLNRGSSISGNVKSSFPHV